MTGIKINKHGKLLMRNRGEGRMKKKLFLRSSQSTLIITVLKTVKLPAAVAHLDAGLTEVKGKNFSHA